MSNDINSDLNGQYRQMQLKPSCDGVIKTGYSVTSGIKTTP